MYDMITINEVHSVVILWQRVYLYGGVQSVVLATEHIRSKKER